MKFIQWHTQQWQHNPWYDKKILWEGNQWNKLQEICIPPHETAKAHHHKIQTEVFYFLTDNGYRIVNNEKILPKKGDILVIEPNDMHTVVNDTDQEYVYLAFKVNYADNDLHRE